MVAAGLCQGAIVLLAWWRNRLTVGQVLGIAVLMRVLVFWLPPGISDDGWRYAWDGLVQAHGFSPYAHAPAGPELQVLHGSRALAEMNSADLFTVYPPLSQGLFLLGGLIERAGAPTLASIYLIKAMLAGAELCGVMLLARLVTPRALLL